MIIVERYTVPTKYDMAPHGQICVVKQDAPVYYIQVSSDENHATWLRYGEFLEVVFAESINDKHFIQNSLDMYKIKSRAITESACE